MKALFRIISAFLCLFIIAAAGISCSDDTGSGGEPGGQSDTGDNPADADPLEGIKPDIEAVNYGGIKYRILTLQPDEPSHIIEEIMADMTGAVLDNAIYERNLKIYEKYNIEFETFYETSHTRFNDAVKKSVSAGLSEYDVLFSAVTDVFTLAIAGNLRDISEVPHLDFDKPWWHGDVMADTSVGGRLYYASGASGIRTYNSSQVFVLNKELAEKYQVGNIYDVVNDGKWTYDRMIEAAKKVSGDLNGNSKRDADDLYGIGVGTSASIVLPNSVDCLLIKKDSSDIPYFDFSEKFINFFMRMISDFSDDTYTYFDAKYGGAQASNTAFLQGRQLMNRIDLSYVEQLRDMAENFGIIPTPKYDEGQENYITVIHPAAMSVVAVPITSMELDMIGRITEDMTYQSYQSLIPAYKEILLKGQISRDEESAAMLDIVFSSMRLDLAFAFQSSGVDAVTNLRSLLSGFNPNIASQLASSMSRYETQLGSIVNSLIK